MSPSMLMCRACGNFVRAVEEDGTLVPIKDSCPECGGTEFKDNNAESDERIDDG